ncbi:DinQ-like type I toxin DqlB [Klebsiella pneumoniae]|nr:DinQ-like type I toxin DqlB [Klebsiella pneumoniae]
MINLLIVVLRAVVAVSNAVIAVLELIRSILTDRKRN